MQCPRCRTEIVARKGVCPSCGTDLSLAYRVNFAAGAVILAAGAFFLALAAAETTLTFLPIGIVELGVGLFIDIKAVSGLRRMGDRALGSRARDAEKSPN